MALLTPIIQCASHPGDLVFDPFTGSGTTGAAALLGHRRFVGCELNSQYANAAELRLSHVAESIGTQFSKKFAAPR